MLHGKSIGFRSQALSMAHKTKAPADNEWPGPSRVHPPRQQRTPRRNGPSTRVGVQPTRCTSSCAARRRTPSRHDARFRRNRKRSAHDAGFPSVTRSGHSVRPSLIQTAQPALVEGDDFDPVCALSCRVASDQLQRAGLGVDHIGRDRVRLFAGDNHEAAGQVDIETARLLLG